ncbi:unnamed protein product [Ceutorhynchus assimilis]|uniref:Uncharacterized protein n=1 Tax=Ceutorhynchus assimilis TaxID=467358 RepID=A0A9P0GSU4_9CUCU|nr:unnamed protein product [Ceutorhynchus assimilis]
MFFLVLGLTCVFNSVYSVSIQQKIFQDQWDNFKLKYEKLYETPEEETYRMAVYMKNWESILEHNKLYSLNISTYWMDMNEFGDLTDEEFRRYYLMSPELYDSEEAPSDSVPYFENPGLFPLPETVDWRALAAISEVKNQGKCGACYAFTATGALEAQHYLASKRMISLSEQNILDCTCRTREYKNRGCLGGRVDITFNYIIHNAGIDTEASYPYKAAKNRKCNFNTTNIGAIMEKYVKIKRGNEKDLQAAVARVGPVAVMVDANGMKFYSGGLYQNPKCTDKVSHGMLVVGYGKWRNLDYWLVKNSWGIEWGEKGYIMMTRNKKNQCAIASEALYPIV